MADSKWGWVAHRFSNVMSGLSLRNETVKQAEAFPKSNAQVSTVRGRTVSSHSSFTIYVISKVYLHQHWDTRGWFMIKCTILVKKWNICGWGIVGTSAVGHLSGMHEALGSNPIYFNKSPHPRENLTFERESDYSFLYFHKQIISQWRKSLNLDTSPQSSYKAFHLL